MKCHESTMIAIARSHPLSPCFVKMNRRWSTPFGTCIFQKHKEMFQNMHFWTSKMFLCNMPAMLCFFFTIFLQEPIAPKHQQPAKEFIPVATTRPETILGDAAVCVHPEVQQSLLHCWWFRNLANHLTRMKPCKWWGYLPYIYHINWWFAGFLKHQQEKPDWFVSPGMIGRWVEARISCLGWMFFGDSMGVIEWSAFFTTIWHGDVWNLFEALKSCQIQVVSRTCPILVGGKISPGNLPLEFGADEVNWCRWCNTKEDMILKNTSD